MEQLSVRSAFSCIVSCVLYLQGTLLVLPLRGDSSQARNDSEALGMTSYEGKWRWDVGHGDVHTACSKGSSKTEEWSEGTKAGWGAR